MQWFQLKASHLFIIIKNMKKLILAALLSIAVIGAGVQISSAQVNSAVGGQSIWKMVSGSIQPMVSSWTLGSSSSRISEIWATTLNATSLTVAGTASGALNMGGYAISNGGTITGTKFVATSTTATSTFAGGLAVETSGLVYDYSTNNVGIGTAAPRQKLDVVGNSVFDGFSGFGTQYNTVNPTAAVDIRQSAGAQFSIRPLESAAHIFTMSSTDGVGTTFQDNYGYLRFNTGVVGTAATAMTLLGNGNVGIGTTTPMSPLSISSVNDGIISIANTILNQTTHWGFHSGTSPSADFGTTGSFPLSIETNDTTRLWIAAAGNIGMGTSSPEHLLDLYSTGTTTQRIDSNSVTKGACIALKDTDGVGYTYVYGNNGALTASTVACN